VVFSTPGDDWHSLAVCSSGQYGVPDGLQFGFPVRSDGSSWSVVEGIEHDDFAQGKIAVTTQELIDERDEVRALGLIGS
jgi:malate dehydrogenase